MSLLIKRKYLFKLIAIYQRYTTQDKDATLRLWYILSTILLRQLQLVLRITMELYKDNLILKSPTNYKCFLLFLLVALSSPHFRLSLNLITINQKITYLCSGRKYMIWERKFYRLSVKISIQVNQQAYFLEPIVISLKFFNWSIIQNLNNILSQDMDASAMK